MLPFTRLVRNEISFSVSLINHATDIVFLFQALVTRLCEGIGPNANNALAAGVLATVGELAKVVIVQQFFHLVVLDPFILLDPNCDNSLHPRVVLL